MPGEKSSVCSSFQLSRSRAFRQKQALNRTLQHKSLQLSTAAAELEKRNPVPKPIAINSCRLPAEPSLRIAANALLVDCILGIPKEHLSGGTGGGYSCFAFHFCFGPYFWASMQIPWSRHLQIGPQPQQQLHSLPTFIEMKVSVVGPLCVLP